MTLSFRCTQARSQEVSNSKRKTAGELLRSSNFDKGWNVVACKSWNKYELKF